MRKTSIDMTHGPMALKILAFALPIAFSSILQQLFNSADVAVVGRFVGPQALAAVGSNGPMINLQINLFVGLSTGASVVLARYLGSKHTEQIRKTVHTCLWVALASGILMMGVGNMLSRPILLAMGTPDDVIDLATLYIRIYFLGMPQIMVYDFGAAILRSKGDTTRPMVFLLLSGLVNVLLNLLFVVGFGWGVAGVAIATVLSNTLSSALVLHVLLTEEEPIRLHPRQIRLDLGILKEIAYIGIPAGLQASVFSISNILILSAVNSFGAIASAGNATAVNFDAFVYFMCLGFTQASATFTSQNYGFGDAGRCRRAWHIAIGFGLFFTAILSFVTSFWARPLASIYSTDPKVLDYACMRLVTVQPWQWMTAVYEITAATLRGIGYSLLPSLITVFGIVLFRIFWIFTIFPMEQSFTLLMSVYPITWTLTDSLMLIAYFLASRKVWKKLDAKKAATPDA